MKSVRFPSGDSVCALGQGTWNMGESAATRGAEIASLRQGLDEGLSLVDTAEMYGDGRTETMVGEAIAGRRDEVFLVSKVYPHNAGRAAMRRACEASLRRLRTDRLDLYLLHWPGSVPLEETLQGFADLQRDGLIRNWGVSNFDTDDMQELWDLPGGPAVQTNQVFYNLTRRGIERTLLSWQRAQGVPLMAYSPIEQGRLLRDAKLVEFARRHGRTPAQAALGWVLAGEGVVAIPKTGNAARMRENLAALRDPLPAQAVEELGLLFPPPRGPVPLEML